MNGKRKRDGQRVARIQEVFSQDTAPAHTSDVFRQYFESQFEPLREFSKDLKAISDGDRDKYISSDSASVSDWNGLSEDESTPQVEIISFGEKQESPRSSDDLQHAKAFMSAKPPSLADLMFVPDKSKQRDQDSSEETAAEAVNLKHDLDLQRLLRESHLLDRSFNSTLSHAHHHRAIDLRVQSLGAKSSLFNQEKMPLAHRRGIIMKANQKEATRRKEAKESGIILEKQSTASNITSVRRERGIGGPTIGKFNGGTLKLSRKDINDIQGPERSQRMARKRRR